MVVEPRLVTELLPDDPGDVLACVPSRCSRRYASAFRAPSSLGKRLMACGYGGCYGCVVEVDGHYLRLCVEGPVL